MEIGNIIALVFCIVIVGSSFVIGFFYSMSAKREPSYSNEQIEAQKDNSTCGVLNKGSTLNQKKIYNISAGSTGLKEG